MMITRRVFYFVVFLAVFPSFVTASFAANEKTPSTAPSSVPKSVPDLVQPASESTSILPEMLSAKTYLEDLITRRYSQDLASLVEKQSFSLATQIELTKSSDTRDPQSDDDYPADLTVGALDPETFLGKKGYEDAIAAPGSLKNFRMVSVSISVGLKDTLAADVKGKVEKWLTDRLNSEFGKAGKGAVAIIQEPAEKKIYAPPKTFFDWLSQFQELAGQLAVALAILSGVLLWVLASPKKVQSKEEGMGSSDSGRGALKGAVDGGEVSKVETEKKTAEADLPLGDAEYQEMVRGLGELSQKLSSSYEFIVRNWCQGGEEGMLKLASFAEAAGKDLGKLPIPSDSMALLSRVFLNMPNLSLKVRREALQKAYWDVIALTRLGPESLEQPFNYISGMRVGMINQILMDQNPKLKALVSLYMPFELRKSFLQSLDLDVKQTLLNTIAQMTEIPREELSLLDKTVKSKVEPDKSENVVSLAQGLVQFVSALSPIDQLRLLPGLEGPAFEKYKRTVPSLAFLDLWKDEYVIALMRRALPDEVLAYLRVKPEQKDRILGFCPPMIVELINEELDKKDGVREKEKNELLSRLAQRIEEMIQARELDFEQAFPDLNTAAGEVSQTSPPPQKDVNENQPAA